MAQGFQADSCSTMAQTRAGSSDCAAAARRASATSCAGKAMRVWSIAPSTWSWLARVVVLTSQKRRQDRRTSMKEPCRVKAAVFANDAATLLFVLKAQKVDSI